MMNGIYGNEFQPSRWDEFVLSCTPAVETAAYFRDVPLGQWAWVRLILHRLGCAAAINWSHVVGKTVAGRGRDPILPGANRLPVPRHRHRLRVAQAWRPRFPE